MKVIKTILDQIHTELEYAHNAGRLTEYRQEVLIALVEALKYAIKAA